MKGQAFSRGLTWLLADPLPCTFSRQEARPATHRKTKKERQVAVGSWGGGGERGDGQGAESKDHKEAWSSINHSLLSDSRPRFTSTYNSNVDNIELEF